MHENGVHKKVKNIVRRKVVNLKNGGKGKTLTEIVDDLRKSNIIKDDICNFSLIKDRMTKILDEKGNIIKSYF